MTTHLSEVYQGRGRLPGWPCTRPRWSLQSRPTPERIVIWRKKCIGCILVHWSCSLWTLHTKKSDSTQKMVIDAHHAEHPGRKRPRRAFPWVRVRLNININININIIVIIFTDARVEENPPGKPDGRGEVQRLLLLHLLGLQVVSGRKFKLQYIHRNGSGQNFGG